MLARRNSQKTYIAADKKTEPNVAMNLERTGTVVELKRAECVLVDVCLPGQLPETAGVLLLDSADNKLYVKFRNDWDDFAPEESDVLFLMADQLEKYAVEMGGERVLAYLEQNWSHVLTTSDREVMLVASFEARLRRLFRENVKIAVTPFRTHLPLTSCQAAAGHLGEQLGLDEIKDWVPVPATLRPNKDMFVARVTGHSMEPLIPSDSLCVFRHNVAGSRSGRKLLIEKFGEFDEATRFTIKVYRSEKLRHQEGQAGRHQESNDEWEHSMIRLEPLNPAYSPWELEPDQFRVVGEFVAVLPAEE